MGYGDKSVRVRIDEGGIGGFNPPPVPLFIPL